MYHVCMSVIFDLGGSYLLIQ